MLIVTCHNDGTRTDPWGNYYCEVRVNNKVIAKGRIEAHYRPAGWRSLLRRVVDELESNP